MTPITLLFNGVWSQYVFAMTPKYRDFYRLNKPSGKTSPVNRTRPLLYNRAPAPGVLASMLMPKT